MTTSQKMQHPLFSAFPFRKGRTAKIGLYTSTPFKVHVLGATVSFRMWDGASWKRITTT